MQQRTSRSPLALAVGTLVASMTVDELAETIGETRSTAGRRRQAVVDEHHLDGWTAGNVEALAYYEMTTLKTTSIQRSLGPQKTITVDGPFDYTAMIVGLKHARARMESVTMTCHRYAVDKNRVNDVEALGKVQQSLQEVAKAQHMLREFEYTLEQRIIHRDGLHDLRDDERRTCHGVPSTDR